MMNFLQENQFDRKNNIRGNSNVKFDSTTEETRYLLIHTAKATRGEFTFPWIDSTMDLYGMVKCQAHFNSLFFTDSLFKLSCLQPDLDIDLKFTWNWLFLRYYYILLFVSWFQQVGEEVGNSKLYAYCDNIQIMLLVGEAWNYRMYSMLR